MPFRILDESSIVIWKNQAEYYKMRYKHLKHQQARIRAVQDFASGKVINVFDNKNKCVWIVEIFPLYQRLVHLLLENRWIEVPPVMYWEDLWRVMTQLQTIIKGLQWIPQVKEKFVEEINNKREVLLVKPPKQKKYAPIQQNIWVDANIEEPLTNEAIIEDVVGIIKEIKEDDDWIILDL